MGGNPHAVFRRNGLHYTSKHRVWIAIHSLSGACPLKPLLHHRKDVFIMNEFLFLIIGIFTGDLCGVTVMCLFQIHHLYDKEDKEK